MTDWKESLMEVWSFDTKPSKLLIDMLDKSMRNIIELEYKIEKLRQELGNRVKQNVFK